LGKYHGHFISSGCQGIPFSAFVSSRFVRPALEQLSGQTRIPHPSQKARLAGRSSPVWARILPAAPSVTEEQGQLTVLLPGTRDPETSFL